MGKKKLQHSNTPLTREQRERYARVREAVLQEYPPKNPNANKPAPTGIPARIRAARESQGLTWYALARLAGIPNQATIRDLELGKDVKLSNLQAVAAALGMEIELVEAAIS